MSVHPNDYAPQLVSPLLPGMAVRDRKRPAPDDTAEVIEVTDTPAEEWTVERIGRTVAEDNPKYPASDKVVKVKHDPDGRVYHFPFTRLVPDAEIRDVPPGELVAWPEHDREYEADENRGYIDDVRRNGYVESVITVRETPRALEIVDGHKRRWVAEQAGLDTVAAWVVDLDDDEATALYRRCHE